MMEIREGGGGVEETGELAQAGERMKRTNEVKKN